MALPVTLGHSPTGLVGLKRCDEFLALSIQQGVDWVLLGQLASYTFGKR